MAFLTTFSLVIFFNTDLLFAVFAVFDIFFFAAGFFIVDFTCFFMSLGGATEGISAAGFKSAEYSAPNFKSSRPKSLKFVAYHN